MNLNLTPCVCLGILQSPYIFENKICAASEGLHKVPNFTRWSAAALGFEPRVIWLSYKKGRKKRKYSEMTQELLSPACRWVVRFWDMAIKFRYSQGTDSVVSIEWKQEGWWGWWVIWTGFQRKNLCHHVCHNTTGLEEVWSCPIQPLVFTGEETKVSRGAVLLLSWGHVMWRLMVPQRPFNRTTLWGVYMPFHFCSDKNPVREAGQTCLLLVGSEGVRPWTRIHACSDPGAGSALELRASQSTAWRLLNRTPHTVAWRSEEEKISLRTFSRNLIGGELGKCHPTHPVGGLFSTWAKAGKTVECLHSCLCLPVTFSNLFPICFCSRKNHFLHVMGLEYPLSYLLDTVLQDTLLNYGDSLFLLKQTISSNYPANQTIVNSKFKQ